MSLSDQTGSNFIPMNNEPILTKNAIISVDGGNVLHGLKSTDAGFDGFGEAYFSLVDKDYIKAWKRHRVMTLNFIVISGKIKIVTLDDSKNKFFEFNLSTSNYHRLTIPPMYWVGFKGMSAEQNILLNIANIPHDPDEVDRKEIQEVDYKW